MESGSRLTVRAYHISDVAYGIENSITANGIMKVNSQIAEEIKGKEPLIKEINIRIIQPHEHEQNTNAIMDVIPLSVKALGKIGEGVTHTLTGAYVLLTGIDESGRQICNSGVVDGTLKENIVWGRAGTPLESDILISFDVTTKAGTWSERPVLAAVHRSCEMFCQIFREQMRGFRGSDCTEKHVFQETYKPGRKDVVIVKEVSGQGALYDTRLFGEEPCGFQGGRSVIEMGCMPVLVTPNEFRDGIMRAMG